MNEISVPKLKTGIYEHYKGNQYRVIGVGIHSETLEPVVIYEPLYKSKAKLWVRPYEMFIGEVVIEGVSVSRFRKV